MKQKTYAPYIKRKFGGKIFTAPATSSWYADKRSAKRDASSLQHFYFVRIVKQTTAPVGYRLYTRPKNIAGRGVIQ